MAGNVAVARLALVEGKANCLLLCSYERPHGAALLDDLDLSVVWSNLLVACVRISEP
jgi:hypothetical protein